MNANPSLSSGHSQTVASAKSQLLKTEQQNESLKQVSVSNNFQKRGSGYI